MFYSQVWLCDQVWPSEWSYTYLHPHSPPAGWNVDVTAECHKSFWPRRQKPCFLVGVGQQKDPGSLGLPVAAPPACLR